MSRIYVNPSGRRVAKRVYLDSNKVFNPARSAIKFANEFKHESLAASKTAVPLVAPLALFVAPIAVPASVSDALAPLSSNAHEKRRVGSPTPGEADQEGDKGALINEQFDVFAASMGVPDVKNYFDSGFNLSIAQEGSFPIKFVPLRNALIQNGLHSSSPTRRPPKIQAAVQKSKLSEPVDPIPFTMSEQDEAEREINLVRPIIKFVSERKAVGYDSWIHSMFNGKEEYDRTNKVERERAMRTQLLNFGGSKGANLATVTLRNAISFAKQWHEEMGYEMLFPMPGAYVANMAEVKKLASKSFATSGATTVPYKFKSILDSAQEKLNFPGNKGVPIASVKKSKAAPRKKTKPLPIALMEGMQRLATDDSQVESFPT